MGAVLLFHDGKNEEWLRSRNQVSPCGKDNPLAMPGDTPPVIST